eukprot:2601923-Lingulodinium_polyedra.AAC.1
MPKSLDFITVCVDATEMSVALVSTFAPPRSHVLEHAYDGRWRVVFTKLLTALPGKSRPRTQFGINGERD